MQIWGPEEERPSLPAFRGYPGGGGRHHDNSHMCGVCYPYVRYQLKTGPWKGRPTYSISGGGLFTGYEHYLSWVFFRPHIVLSCVYENI